RDDFGLSTGVLTVDAGGSRTATRALVPPGDGAPPLNLLFLELLELKDLLQGRPADGLALQIDFTDNRQPQANTTHRPRRQVQVVARSQLAAAIARHFRGLREEVEQAFDLQQDRRARL